MSSPRSSNRNGNPKICFLTSVHDPENIRIFHKEAISLSAAGYDVTIVAPGEMNRQAGPIRIKAVPPPRQRLDRMTKTVWNIYRAGLSEGALVYHFHDPELIPVGLLLKARGKRVVYDVHEDVPRDILDKFWIPTWLRRLVAILSGLFELSAARRMDGIVAATPSIARRFTKAHTVTVRNYPLLNELDIRTEVNYCDRPLLFAYVGGITEVRGVRQIVQALSLLPPSLGARCDLAGAFDPPELEQEISKMPGWPFVRFLRWQSRQGVAGVLSRARAGLLVLHPTEGFLESLPVKLFEYMTAGLPVIASDFPVWREIIDPAGCGILVDPLDPRAIADAMIWILEHPKEAEGMGRRGAEAVQSTYNWSAEEKTLLGLYASFFKVDEATERLSRD
jgi:glycosyltransferase involved in cell wall biosynthesis